MSKPMTSQVVSRVKIFARRVIATSSLARRRSQTATPDVPLPRGLNRAKRALAGDMRGWAVLGLALAGRKRRAR
jgi:hypothetical protein